MNYLDITKCSVADGKGIRIVLWVSGCDHHCEGCHNPQSWDFNKGKPFTSETREKILKELENPYVWGVTISGGEPLHFNNITDVYNLCREIKEKYSNKTIWLYTGFTFEQLFIPKGYWTTSDVNIVRDLGNDILNYIDVLVDGQFIEEKRDLTLAFRGSSNQRIIDVKKTLEKNEIVLYETEVNKNA